jgi:hypothetical protein
VGKDAEVSDFAVVCHKYDWLSQLFIANGILMHKGWPNSICELIDLWP